MKKWPWRKILAVVAGCLVVAGLYPFAACLWLAYGPRPQPFLMQLPTKKGEYTSAPITAGFSGPYWIGLRLPASVAEDQRVALDLDWKIVDDKDRVVVQSSQHEIVAGNTIALAGYPSGLRKGQRVIVTLPHDIQGVGDSMQLNVSVDTAEIGLDLSYGWLVSIIIAGIVAGPGVLLLIFLAVWKSRSHRTSHLSLS